LQDYFLAQENPPNLQDRLAGQIQNTKRLKSKRKKELQRIKDPGTTTDNTENTLQYNREKLGSIVNTSGINYSSLTDNELRSSIRAEIKKDKNTAQ
jgi:RNase adaptor protein for sRNA GlmZ degradation